MTPEQLREIMYRRGWDSRTVARLLRGPRGDDRLVRRWLTGAREIPPEDATFLALLHEWIQLNQPPWLEQNRKDRGEIVPGNNGVSPGNT